MNFNPPPLKKREFYLFSSYLDTTNMPPPDKLALYSFYKKIFVVLIVTLIPQLFLSAMKMFRLMLKLKEFVLISTENVFEIFVNYKEFNKPILLLVKLSK